MHPHLSALIAAEHVRDMRADATVAQRVREARRARRDQRSLAVTRSVRNARPVQPCPQPPCAPRTLSGRAA